MKNALIIFTRNPVIGQCKTRLARKTGDKIALEIYKILLEHTVEITKDLKVDKYVFYSESIIESDIWDNSIYNKLLQEGGHLGKRMENAFSHLFKQSYNKVIIVGSDILDLTAQDIEYAFSSLNDHDITIGPAEDGGYYLLGMKRLYKDLFTDKKWGENSVLKDTLDSVKNLNIKLLKKLNDIDTFEDLIKSDYYSTHKELQILVSQIDD